MVTTEIIIKHKMGLDGLCPKFLKCAFKYKSDVSWAACGHTSTGKSNAALMSLDAAKGDVLRITADGPDAQEMIDELVEINEKYA